MKFLRFIIAILIIVIIILWIRKIKNSFSNTVNIKNLSDEFGSIMNSIDIKWISSWDIQNSLTWKMDEAKWMAEQYYNDVLKDYVDKAKEWVSWAVENAKWYYNQWIDDLWETITNKINTKVVEGLDKIKAK